jgi:hypothetical protein
VCVCVKERDTTGYEPFDLKKCPHRPASFRTAVSRRARIQNSRLEIEKEEKEDSVQQAGIH